MLPRFYDKIQVLIQDMLITLKPNKGMHISLNGFKFNRKTIGKQHSVLLAFSFHIYCENDAVWLLNQSPGCTP